MAWRELPKGGIYGNGKRRVLDDIDIQAEREGDAIRNGPTVIGPLGKKIKKQQRGEHAGRMVQERRVLNSIDIQ